MRDYETLGTKLGPKLARLIRDTIIDTKRGLAQLDRRTKARAAQDVIDHAGHETADLWRPLIHAVLNDPDAKLHPEAREFLTKIASGEHQWHSLLGALGTLGQSALSQAIGNAVAPITYQINRLGPNLDLDPQTAAQAAASNIISAGEGAATARDQGYDSGEFQTLLELAYAIPDQATLADLVNRGELPEGSAEAWLRRAAVPPPLIPAVAQLRHAVLAPDLAALAVLRGSLTKAQGEAIAAKSGVSAADFQIMIDDTGEPLALEQLLEAYRRGFVGQERLVRGILQSRIRDEWIDVALKLRYSPMSVSDAVNAVVQNHLSAAEGESIAQQNGLEPGSFPILQATAGEPLSRTEFEELYNRGLVPKSTVIQGLRESRLKDKYLEDAFNLHEKLPEPRMLSAAVQDGAVSSEQAIKYAMDYGYSRQVATMIVTSGKFRKLQTYRDRVIAAVETLYEDNVISESEAHNLGRGLGYDAADLDFILQATTFRRESKIVTQVTSAIRSKYLGRHITEKEAGDLLTALGVPAAQRDTLLGAWLIEWTAYTRQLTEAQVIKAEKHQVITTEQALERLEYMGYSKADAEILIKVG